MLCGKVYSLFFLWKSSFSSTFFSTEKIRSYRSFDGLFHSFFLYNKYN